MTHNTLPGEAAKRRRRFLALGLAGAALVASGATWRAFASEMTRARARLEGRSEVFQGRFGPMEYAAAGSGPAILMIHGTGGGFDQGLDFAQPLISKWRVIAPSRFGYLRSAFPADPSSESQADAIVELLDQLGALSAMQFAIRHPDRCRALVALVPISRQRTLVSSSFPAAI